MNELILYGTVGDNFWGEEYFTPSDVRDKLASMSGPLKVRINSGGGIATDGHAIYLILSDYADSVQVLIEGIAASAASLIAMAGDEIIMREGSIMMVHDPAQMWTEGRGTEDDHLRAAGVLGMLGNNYASVYARRTGVSVESARQIMKDETWFDPAGALAAGFATATDVTEADVAASFDYRIYQRAPQILQNAAAVLGGQAGHNKRAVATAMMAAMTAFGSRSMKMDPEEDQVTAEEALEEEDEDEAAGGAGDGAADGEADTGADDAAEEDEDAEEEDDVPVAAQILDLAMALGRPLSEARDMIACGATAAHASKHFTAQMKKENPMKANAGGRAAARVTMDARDKFITGATLALSMKAGIGSGERNEFTSMSLSELARVSLSLAGERPADDKMRMIGQAFTMSGAGSHTTSDFANVLSNVMGKAALKGWEEAEETFERWTVKGTLSDFKPTKRVGLGLFGALPKVGEDGEFKYGTVGDRGEEIMLATYGKLLRITRQAIINDDLSLLGTLPLKLGRAAKYTIGDLAYGVLTSNPTMSDGKPLFHADHGNLAASGSAPGVTSFDAGRKAMRTQKDAGSVLNITSRYLITPASLELAATEIMLSTVDPRDNKGHAKNPVAGAAEVIADGRLDGSSATAWYLVADPARFDTIEIAYLDGNDTPFLEEQTSWGVDGVEMKVRIDAAAAPIDWLAVYKNAGA